MGWASQRWVAASPMFCQPVQQAQCQFLGPGPAGPARMGSAPVQCRYDAARGYFRRRCQGAAYLQTNCDSGMKWNHTESATYGVTL
jgi:hypothetical protein